MPITQIQTLLKILLSMDKLLWKSNPLFWVPQILFTKHLICIFIGGKDFKHAKRLIIAVIGFTVLLIGIAMIVLPCPAIVVIPIGLGILATEFVWARKILKHVKDRISNKGGTNHASKTK